MSRLRRLANLTEDLGPGYENSVGKVTPYHILFKDFGNQIADLPKDQAVKFVIDKIEDLNHENGNDPDYDKISAQQIESLKEELLENNSNGMDVLFDIKDRLLASEGSESAVEKATENDTEDQTPTQEEIPSAPETEVDPAPVEQPAESNESEQSNTQASFVSRLKKHG